MKKLISLLIFLLFSFAVYAHGETIRVVYKPDKSVAILYPASNSKRVNETNAQWLTRVFAEMMEGPLEGLPYDDIDSSELPQSREYRNAWEGEKGKRVSINAQKKEKIKQERLIRKEKKKLLHQQAIKNLKARGQLPEDYPIE